MLSEPRTISLLCEVVHIPMKHLPESLREVYNRVCSSCGYENFIRIPSGARIERQDQEGGFSHLTFSGDRIQFTEDHIGISVDQFAKKVSAVLHDAYQVLRIPVILAEQATVRVIATPNSSRTAAEFLAQRIFRIRMEDFEAFERPASIHGLRLTFPSTRDEVHGFNVRIETYLRDPRSLYIENIGTFKTPMQPQSLETVESNIQLTSQFISEKLIPFLSRYDAREVEP